LYIADPTVSFLIATTAAGVSHGTSSIQSEAANFPEASRGDERGWGRSRCQVAGEESLWRRIRRWRKVPPALAEFVHQLICLGILEWKP
jgi:hypothetical protein